MFFFVIPVAILLIAMLAFAFWPRKPHFVDRDELDHPGGPDANGPF